MTHLTTLEELRTLDLSVEIIQRLGVDTDDKILAVDGIIGPKTSGATYLHPECDLHPLVAVAMAELLAGAEEIGGNNRGKWVAKYYRRKDDGRNHGAWCAAFVSWCLGEEYGGDAPYSWGARRLVNAVQKEGQKVALEDVQEGDVIGWKRESKATNYAGHVGIVAHVTNEHIYTIEGNNGPKGRVRVWRYNRENPARGATGPLWGIGRLGA